jgi:Domain of unknown function (DUF397)
MPDLSHATWRKSTYSGNGGNCVEVAANFVAEHGLVLVRDSKDLGGPILTFTRSEWTAFLRGTTAGEFDL